MYRQEVGTQQADEVAMKCKLKLPKKVIVGAPCGKIMPVLNKLFM